MFAKNYSNTLRRGLVGFRLSDENLRRVWITSQAKSFRKNSPKFHNVWTFVALVRSC